MTLSFFFSAIISPMLKHSFVGTPLGTVCSLDMDPKILQILLDHAEKTKNVEPESNPKIDISALKPARVPLDSYPPPCIDDGLREGEKNYWDRGVRDKYLVSSSGKYIALRYGEVNSNCFNKFSRQFLVKVLRSFINNCLTSPGTLFVLDMKELIDGSLATINH